MLPKAPSRLASRPCCHHRLWRREFQDLFLTAETPTKGIPLENCREEWGFEPKND